MQSKDKNVRLELSDRYRGYMFAKRHLGGICGGKVFPLESADRQDIDVSKDVKQDAKGIATRHLGRNGGLIADQASTLQVAEVPCVTENMRIRRLTPCEAERLQGFPDGWTSILSDSQRYKCLGNAVTTNVIEAIMEKIL